MKKSMKIFMALALALFMTLGSFPVNTVRAEEPVTEVAEEAPKETDGTEQTDYSEQPSEGTETVAEKEEGAEQPAETAEGETPAEQAEEGKQEEQPAEAAEQPADPAEEDNKQEEAPAAEETTEEEEESALNAEEPAEETEEVPAETVEEEAPVTEEATEEEVPVYEVTQDGEYKGVKVTVKYPSDTFEKEATLVVSEAGETEAAALKEAFGEDYKAVDISFVDEEGNELQPLEGKSVDVTLAAEGMEATGNYKTVHVDAEGNVSLVEDAVSVETGEVSTKEVQYEVPEEIEVPVYVENTETVVVPAVTETVTVEDTVEIEVPAVMGTRTVEKTREVEVPAVYSYQYVRKTRTVEKTRQVRVQTRSWYNPFSWFKAPTYKTETYEATEYYYELEPVEVRAAYTKTETYYEEEEYEITPAYTETKVVGTHTEERVVTPARTETVTNQVQVGTEWQETGKTVTEVRTVNVTTVEAAFAAEEFSTYAIYTTTITSGQEYVIYRDGYALTHALGRLAVTVSGYGDNQTVTSDSDEIKWLFESSATGYKISYSNNGVKTYLRNANGTLTTTTNADDSGTTWYWDSNNTRLYMGNGQSRYYLKYRGDQWQAQTGNGARSVSLALQQGGSGPASGINVHYVDTDGNVIKTFTVDETTQEYCDIAETISVATATGDHYNTYTATSGTMYDLVFAIDGYTYDSTYLTSYTSASSHGTKINAEVFRRSSGVWGYTSYGGAAGADDYTEDIYNFGSITDVYVVYSKNASDDGSGGGGDESEQLDEPSTGKTVTDNNDGTSTISLSIAGSSKDISKNQGANVIVIIDTSNSMTDTRLAAAKEAARDVATDLLGLNGQNPGDDPLVEMFLIYFNTAAHPGTTWYSVAGANNTTNTTEGFNGAVNSITRHAGTNWESALSEALTQAQSHLAEEAQRPGRSDESSADYGRVDDTYVIFITDGQPSSKANDTNDYNDEAGTEEFYTQANYVQATDEARAIVEAGYDFYSIGIYGTIDVLHYLTNFAFTERSTYDTSKSSTANANNHFFTANNADTLSTVLGEIANTISGKLAVAGVSFSDGIATSVTSTNISASNASGFVYTVTNASGSKIYTVKIDTDGTATYTFGPASSYNGETFTVASNASGTAGTGSNGTSYTGTCKAVTTSFDYTTPGGESGTKTSTTTVYTVKIGDTEYKMSPATVDANGEVGWDLSGVGTIDSGYVWTVSFVVWPDQEAYDIVTDLNNGIETEYKWIDYDADAAADDPDSCAKAKYVNGTLQYYYDGVFVKDGENWVLSEYTHIVKYPNGTYAALTNTHQDVEYFIMNEDGTYIGPVNKAITPPDPISLDAALATVQKKWEVGLDKEQLIYALFDTWTGNSNKLSVTLHVFADGSTTEYTSKELGWKDNGDGTGAYDWADETEDITLYGNTYTVGTLWEDDLSIAVGVMIDEVKAEEYGLTGYPYAMIGGVKYYVLEPGHDYDITETGFQNYRFDYISRTYHPMLVDGKMYNLENLHLASEPDADGKQYYIFDDVEANMTALVAHNTLRGGINIKKDVVDGDENAYDTDALFTFDVKLENEAGSLVEDSIPWYGVANGAKYADNSLIYFYYHDTDGKLYQASGVTTNTETGVVTFTLYDEEGNSYAATSTEFKEQAGPADITYTDGDGNEVTIALYGNVMTANSAGTSAEATVSIPSSGDVRIANVPYKTTYTVTETKVTGFDLIKIEQTIRVDENTAADETNTLTETDESEIAPDLEAMKVRDTESALIGITDEIVPNRQNNLDFTNQTTDEAFYVYHSSNNKVEKVLFADTRVSNTYDADTDETTYQFNIVNETLSGSLYGGYYKSYTLMGGYTGDVETDDAAIRALSYAASTGSVTTAYDGSHSGGYWATDGGTAYIGDPDVWTTYTDTEKGAYTEAGNEMSPTVDTVYYLKEVPNVYLTPATYVVYDEHDLETYDGYDGNYYQIKKLYLMTLVDDANYLQVGFDVVGKKGITANDPVTATVYEEIDVYRSGTLIDTLTSSSIASNKKGLIASKDVNEYVVENAYYKELPYHITPDNIKVTAVKRMTVHIRNTRWNAWTKPGMTKSVTANTPGYSVAESE